MNTRRRVAFLALAVLAGFGINFGVFQWASGARHVAAADVDLSRARLAAWGTLQRRLDAVTTDLDLAAWAGATVRPVTRDDLGRRRADIAADLRRLSALADAPGQPVLISAADETRDLFVDWEAYVAEAGSAPASAADHLARARQAARRLSIDVVPRLVEDDAARLAAAQRAQLVADGRITAVTWTVFALSLAGIAGAMLWGFTTSFAPRAPVAPAPPAAPAADRALVPVAAAASAADKPVAASAAAPAGALADRPLAPGDVRLRDAQKMQAIGRLAGGVAHDFNNLLTIIKGHTERLLEAAGTQPARIRLEEVQRAADRAAALTSQLLAFSRRQVMAPRIISLNDVVTDLQSLLRPLLGERITLELELDRGLWPVRADPGQLAQVVMNLVVNARDAMPDGGVVVIRSANAAQGDPRVKHTSLAASSLVSLSVRDTGVGMDEATLSQIFEPFFTTKGIGQGTGLGLSTAHGIVGQSGGEILVASAPGKGSTFTIMLPRAVEEAAMPSDEDRKANGGRIPGIRPW